MEILEGNDEEIELSLGLSIGGGRRGFKKFEKSNQENSSLPFEMKFLDQNDDNNNNGLDLEKRKREIHKMRRQEARKKRDIKKNGRKLPEFEQEDEQSSSFKKLKPENEEVDKEKCDVIPSVKYGYHHQSMQCVNPFSNGFGFPSAYQMIPFRVPPPISTSSPPKDKISDSCGSAVVEDHQIGSQFDNETSSTRSAQSPPSNQPHHLDKSNNVQVQSENITATPHPNSIPMIINTSKTELLPPLQSKGSNEDCNNTPPLPPKKVNDEETNQLNKEETNKSPPRAEIQQIKSLPRMPCVSTVGDGPDGKTITGFLYRYTNAEVSIVCVCHGSSFSPAEFVKHAGRTDVSQPLKHIVVLPTPFS